MFKNLLAATALAALSVAPIAAQAQAASQEARTESASARTASNVEAFEELGRRGRISTPVLVALFVVIGIGIILLIDKNDDQELPISV